MEAQQPTSILSQSLAHPMEIPEPKKTTQYDAVKMRYFLSLGMNRPTPQLSSSVPTSSSMLITQLSSVSSTKNNVKRDRTKTNPPTPLTLTKAKDLEDKRTTSIPIPITHGFATPVPIASTFGAFEKQNNVDSDEEYDLVQEDQDKIILEEEEVDIFDHNGDQLLYEDHSPSNNNDSPVKFIPPHEMMRQNSRQGFNVGTAHSVAVWEQRRRKYI